MLKDYKKHRPATKPNLSFEYAEDKVGIFALMHPRQSSMHFSSSSSTESIKRIRTAERPRTGFSACKPRHLKSRKSLKTAEGFNEKVSFRINQLLKPDQAKQLKEVNGFQEKSPDPHENEDTDETVIKNFIELQNESRKEIKGKTKNELSSGMLEIIKVQDQFEQCKEVKKWQTRLQLLQVFKLNSLKDVQHGFSRSFNRDY